MKNYRLPSPTQRTRGLFFNLNKIRAALIVSLLAAVSALPFYVFAQTSDVHISKKPAASFRSYGAGQTFVIAEGPDGNAVCRPATADEARAISAASGGVLHQINHLETNTLGVDSADSVNATTGLKIILRATAQLEANPVAKQAFINAAAKWEAIIKDPITILVDVDYGTSFFGTPFNDPTIIGQTQSQVLYSDGNYPEMRDHLLNHATGSEGSLYVPLPVSTVPSDLGAVNTVTASTPLLRALGLVPAIVDESRETPIFGVPPKIGFNSAFGFDFDPSNGINGTQTDFDAVATHEMGHLLGFNSDVGEREANPSGLLSVSVWDIFRFRPGTATLSNFGTAQRILSSGGTQVQFNGGPEFGLSTGRNSDPIGGDGRQASHWKADEQSGVYIGIMDPTIARGQRYEITETDKRTLDSLGYTLVATTPPANDKFENAQLIAGFSGTLTGMNTFATAEAGEPVHSADLTVSAKSVWYRWTAPASGTAVITTQGSNFDTLLAVYTGSAVNALTLPSEAFRNDDDPSQLVLTSRVEFPATAGTTYQIAVDGYGGDQGNITLNWNLPGSPGANTVQFTTSTANASESFHASTKVDLVISRSGSLSGTASVNYSTSNGSAVDRTDYLASLGTVQFAPGESSKTISVFIIDDGFVEPSETFNVSLSNPVNCSIGSPVAVVVTINSANDSGLGTNPVKDPTFDNEFFVRQHYFDFLNRAPDASGLAFWVGQITECGANAGCIEVRRINVSAAFFLSIEFQETGYLVERLYKSSYGDADGLSTLGTAPNTHVIKVPIVRLNEFLNDSQQIAKGLVVGPPGWEQILENNKVAFTQAFVTRSRFTTKYPTSKTPTEFVNELYANAGITPTPSELSSVIGEFGNGAINTTDTVARARALRRVAENQALVDQEKNKAFVLMQYFGYLRRNPNDPNDTDHTGYEFWLSKLNSFNGNFVNAEMVKAFISSTEYQLRFGP